MGETAVTRALRRLGASARDAPAAPAPGAARLSPTSWRRSTPSSAMAPTARSAPSPTPSRVVFGVGFAIADRIARSLGVAGRRARARPRGVTHVLLEAERAGSTCLPVDELARRLTELLGAPPPTGTIDGSSMTGNWSATTSGSIAARSTRSSVSWPSGWPTLVRTAPGRPRPRAGPQGAASRCGVARTTTRTRTPAPAHRRAA